MPTKPITYDAAPRFVPAMPLPILAPLEDSNTRALDRLTESLPTRKSWRIWISEIVLIQSILLLGIIAIADLIRH